MAGGRLDPVKAARKLWKDSHTDQGRIGPKPAAQRRAADRTTNPEGQDGQHTFDYVLVDSFYVDSAIFLHKAVVGSRRFGD